MASSFSIRTPPSSEDDNPIIKRRYTIKFGKVSMAKPMFSEQDGTTHTLNPQEARLRNLTYSSPLFAEVSTRVDVARERAAGRTQTIDATAEEDQDEQQTTELVWEREDDATMVGELDENGNSIQREETTRAFIGRVPIMLKSKNCNLKDKTDAQLFGLNECPYDQGGYFVINGSEKVLIAQERSAANTVQVFKKKNSPTPFVAEIRSAVEKGTRLISTMQLKLYEKGEGAKGGFGQTIKCTLPYIKSEVPIAIVLQSSRCGVR